MGRKDAKTPLSVNDAVLSKRLGKRLMTARVISIKANNS